MIFCGAIVGLLVLSGVIKNGQNASTVATNDSAVTVEDGVQVIEMMAKGGYSPEFIEAKAGVPTELRVSTEGTYDCTSAIVIPALGYQKMLEPTGTETIKISASDAQGTLRGSCTMGMSTFEIAFK